MNKDKYVQVTAWPQTLFSIDERIIPETADKTIERNCLECLVSKRDATKDVNETRARRIDRGRKWVSKISFK